MDTSRPPRTRVLLVRHGESVHMVEGTVGGPRTCRGLTQRGRDQARALGFRLRTELTDAGPVAVYSSILPRAVETAAMVGAALDARPEADCGLCTWHVPDWADGLPKRELQERHAIPGGGVFRPFETGSETWAEMVVRASRAMVDIADRHRGGTVVLVVHTETVEIAFHALGQLPLYRSFDAVVGPASITEWVTDQDPTRWPPARWTLMRFNEVVPP